MLTRLEEGLLCIATLMSTMTGEGVVRRSSVLVLFRSALICACLLECAT